MFEHFGTGPGQSAELLLDELAKKSRTIGGDRAKNGAEFPMDWRRGLSVLLQKCSSQVIQIARLSLRQSEVAKFSNRDIQFANH